jgi:hypothetical protein
MKEETNGNPQMKEKMVHVKRSKGTNGKLC